MRPPLGEELAAARRDRADAEERRARCAPGGRSWGTARRSTRPRATRPWRWSATGGRPRWRWPAPKERARRRPRRWRWQSGGAQSGRRGSARPRPRHAIWRCTRSSTARSSDLRGELNATLRPDLSDLASSFLRDLTNGRYTELELDEDYGTTLLDDGDPKAVISGGEEDVANLALRLAISQMIAERAGQPLSLLVLDEIFGSLDEDRRLAVVDLLRSLADRFPQVILITHIDSVRDGFDRVIRVGLDVTRGVATARDEPLAGHDVAA